MIYWNCRETNNLNEGGILVCQSYHSRNTNVNEWLSMRWCKLTVSWERLERFQDIIEFALFFPSV